MYKTRATTAKSKERPVKNGMENLKTPKDLQQQNISPTLLIHPESLLKNLHTVQNQQNSELSEMEPSNSCNSKAIDDEFQREGTYEHSKTMHTNELQRHCSSTNTTDFNTSSDKSIQNQNNTYPSLQEHLIGKNAQLSGSEIRKRKRVQSIDSLSECSYGKEILVKGQETARDQNDFLSNLSQARDFDCKATSEDKGQTDLEYSDEEGDKSESECSDGKEILVNERKQKYVLLCAEEDKYDLEVDELVNLIHSWQTPKAIVDIVKGKNNSFYIKFE
jgi:hypothetical protein